VGRRTIPSGLSRPGPDRASTRTGRPARSSRWYPIDYLRASNSRPPGRTPTDFRPHSKTRAVDRRTRPPSPSLPRRPRREPAMHRRDVRSSPSRGGGPADHGAVTQPTRRRVPVARTPANFGGGCLVAASYGARSTFRCEGPAEPEGVAPLAEPIGGRFVPGCRSSRTRSVGRQSPDALRDRRSERRRAEPYGPGPTRRRDVVCTAPTVRPGRPVRVPSFRVDAGRIRILVLYLNTRRRGCWPPNAPGSSGVANRRDRRCHTDRRPHTPTDLPSCRVEVPKRGHPARKLRLVTSMNTTLWRGS
jgi:hypothetical protein